MTEPERRPEPRLVGGLWCTDVLACLDDYVAGTLSPELAAQARAHLAGCDWCARFGGRYAATVRAVRERLGAEEAPPEVSRRILARLGRER
ncbi:MAG: hypothetical protein D6798_07255 [Deltaproteobacteria bacterium]|nr:MAG: hypothetical protein D6798_07255 [Deltaproteobacteria bacterium]